MTYSDKYYSEQERKKAGLFNKNFFLNLYFVLFCFLLASFFLSFFLVLFSFPKEDEKIVDWIKLKKIEGSYHVTCTLLN